MGCKHLPTTQGHVPLRVAYQQRGHSVDAPPKLSGAWQLKETQDDMELDAWRTAGSRDRLPEFSADFGVHHYREGWEWHEGHWDHEDHDNGHWRDHGHGAGPSRARGPRLIAGSGVLPIRPGERLQLERLMPGFTLIDPVLGEISQATFERHPGFR